MTITTKDGTQLYCKDWGEAQLNSDAFEDQMFFLVGKGYRCIAHDRRGHGRSSQPWNRGLPLGQANLLTFDLFPVGPLLPLGMLIKG